MTKTVFIAIFSLIFILLIAMFGNSAFAILREQEPNNTFMQANQFQLDGSIFAGQLYSTSDVDVFKFNVTSPGVLSFSVSPENSTWDGGVIRVSIKNESAEILTMRELKSDSEPIDVEANVAISGYYYLVIDQKPNYTIFDKDYLITPPIATPATPSSLTVKATSASSIFLSWMDNSSDEAGFKIERKQGGCSSTNEWLQVKTVGENAKTYTNTGLTPNTTYAYRVRAYNMDVNSAYSNCASSKTALTGTPKSPTNLNATSTSANQIKLIWTDNSTNETSFEVYRKVGLGSWSLLATKGADIVSHTNGTATGNTSTTTYSYYLQACNGNGCSPATNYAVVPYKPINLTAIATSSSRINLAWADKSSNETGFQIYRKSGACPLPSAWGLIATKGVNSTSHSNTGLSSGTSYSYRVRAYYRSSSQPYAYGYSYYSNCSSATTP